MRQQLSLLEEWRPVDGFPYEVSDKGRVRRAVSARGHKKGHVLSSYLKKGYETVELWKGGERKCFSVHQLVAFAFIGEPPGEVGTKKNQYQINHKNGRKTDNRPSNLEWVSPGENNLHARREGLWIAEEHQFRASGEDNPRAKLTKREVETIRESYERGGHTYNELADKYGVHKTTVGLIIRGETWR